MGQIDERVDQGVSRDLARNRARIVSNTRYGLHLDLRPHASRMQGHIAIRFDLAASTDPLVLDFRDLDASGSVVDGSARNLKVNGATEQLRQTSGHILISGTQHRRKGANTIELDFDSGIAESNRTGKEVRLA